jgi:hypothetical protein
LSRRCRVPSVRAPGLDFHLLPVDHAVRNPPNSPRSSARLRHRYLPTPTEHRPIDSGLFHCAPVVEGVGGYNEARHRRRRTVALR